MLPGPWQQKRHKSGQRFPQINKETHSLMKSEWKKKRTDSCLFTAAVARLSSSWSPCFCPVNLLGVILCKVPETWLLTSAERAGAPAGPSLTRRHHSPLPCDGAETPRAAVTRTPMTHLLPPSKSCWHWSHFDESLSILRHWDLCVLSHMHPLHSFPYSLHTNSPLDSPYSGVTPTLIRLV